MLLKLLARSSWRFYRQHPAQLLLSILGILLGVGIVTAVLITNNSSQRAFALSSEALYGRTTHHISGADGLDQAIYVALARQYPNIPMAPIVTGYVAIDKTLYSILGVDPFAESAFGRTGGNTSLSTSNTGNTSTDAGINNSEFTSLAQALLNPQSLLVSEVSARDNGLTIGQNLTLDVSGSTHSALLAASYSSENPAAATGILLGDIAFVQSILQRGQKIDRIDLILDDKQFESVSRSLDHNVRLAPASTRTQTLQAMTRGFHINLTAMSLLALVVGVFLIHNTMSFAVIQRRELFAIKRIIGVPSRTILMTILSEAAVISLVGSILGIGLGYLLAVGLVQLTTRTINDLYFVLHIQNIWFSPWLIVAGLVIGIGSSLAAALLSALDAASINPVQARQRSMLEQRNEKAIPILAVLGAVIILLGTALALLPVQSLLVGFSALMLIILGYGLTIPWCITVISRAIKPVFDKFSVPLALAAGGIYRNISRTGLAIAALTIAVSATFGVDVMISSFRTTVDQWLRTTLQSDIYVSAPSAVTTQQSQLLDARSLAIARNTPGVKAVSSGVVVDTITEHGTRDMLVLTPHEDSHEGFDLLEGSVEQAWRDWRNPDTLTVMVSEPLATKQNLEPGDQIVLFTELSGDTPFTIAGVYKDFGSSYGKLLIARDTFNKFWEAKGIGSMGIVLDDTTKSAETLLLLRTRLSSTGQPLSIQSNVDIHRLSLAVFDRTFEVTKVLRWLTVGVAFVGIFSALLALHLERAKEFAILRACGATRTRTMSIVLYQTLLMGLFAGVLAMPLGWLMSEILIKVINVRSFGWSMQSTLPSGTILDALLLSCLSAILAGLYPAYRLSRAGIASQLRDD